MTLDGACGGVGREGGKSSTKLIVLSMNPWLQIMEQILMTITNAGTQYCKLSINRVSHEKIHKCSSLILVVFDTILLDIPP
jgi:hypothetical protein